MKKPQNNSTLVSTLQVALSVALLSISAVPSLPAVDAPGTFTYTGSMNTARTDHTATLLPNGKVLVVGGNSNSGIASSSAELYDSASGTWTATGSLNTGRQFHTATLLPNGKVLVAAGIDNSGLAISSAELYDPASGTWSATGSLNTARYWHTATLLPNGKVLVAAGFGSGGVYLTSAELYDPASGTWSATGSLNNGRLYHKATLFANGNVLVAGGLITALFWPARNCTTQPVALGASPAVSTQHALLTPGRCCSMAMCWLQGDMIAVSTCWTARNCTMQLVQLRLQRMLRKCSRQSMPMEQVSLPLGAASFP
jgi:hypothetical protein